MREEITKFCTESKMNEADKDTLLSYIQAACRHWNSEVPTQYIHDLIQRDKVQSGVFFSTLISFNEYEAIAFFKLAPYGVTPEMFSKYKSEFKPSFTQNQGTSSVM